MSRRNRRRARWRNLVLLAHTSWSVESFGALLSDQDKSFSSIHLGDQAEDRIAGGVCAGMVLDCSNHPVAVDRLSLGSSFQNYFPGFGSGDRRPAGNHSSDSDGWAAHCGAVRRTADSNRKWDLRSRRAEYWPWLFASVGSNLGPITVPESSKHASECHHPCRLVSISHAYKADCNGTGRGFGLVLKEPAEAKPHFLWGILWVYSFKIVGNSG